MNRNDIKLILIVLLISMISMIILKLNNTKGEYALVYYEDKIIKSINLNINDKYVVKGYNGNVIIEVNDNKIRVSKENSPRHICSKQGWVSSSLEPITCLPNKIVIKIESGNSKVDTVVR